jgi:hypothetical protein
MSASQKELGDEDARVVRVGDAARTNERLDFAGNAVRTAKYSPLTFLPRNLFEQFHRLAYVYFPRHRRAQPAAPARRLRPWGRGASVMPLAFVLIVTAVKDAYEDWRRHRSDRAENGRLAAVLSPDATGGAQFLPTKWKHVRVGDVGATAGGRAGKRRAAREIGGARGESRDAERRRLGKDDERGGRYREPDGQGHWMPSVLDRSFWTVSQFLPIQTLLQSLLEMLSRGRTDRA